MTIKQKLLSVLDICIADISEETLLQILLDLYEQRKKRIQELEGENAQERQSLEDQRDAMQREMNKARRDPLYFNNARNYFFKSEHTKIVVHTIGGKVSVTLREYLHDIRMQEVKEENF